MITLGIKSQTNGNTGPLQVIFHLQKTNMVKKTIFLLTISIISIIHLKAQDTLKYIGLVKNTLLYESIELYENKTFKWTNEYDLVFSSYGKYEIIGDTLILDFYIDLNEPKTMNISDSIKYVSNIDRTSRFIIENKKLFRLNSKGKIEKSIKDRSIRTKWSWLLGHKYEYYLTENK